MAVLSQQDFIELRDSVFRLGHGKEELKAQPVSMVAWKAAFQSIENDVVAAAPSIKANMDAAFGFTTSPALFRKMFRVWLRWRDRQGG